ncbi:hypothetical protein MMC09_000482 [Bachmanniomyces sp. S44760]|nr:hypothetical protein [Bachmanniomyces sp. S44760]
MARPALSRQTSFLLLPAEIRLKVYSLLLGNQGDETLAIRTEDIAMYESRKPENRSRSSYRVMAGRFRAQSIKTTYYLESNPGIFPSILSVNRQIHQEASHVLYGGHVFDFNMDIESAIPFLSDLTPCALSSIKRINILQRALPYMKDFDRCEWNNLCTFISDHMQLQKLGLGILGGVSPTMPEHLDTFIKSDFFVISKFEGMEWMTQLTTIKGLQSLDIKAYLQHCPPPSSNAMLFFVNFSASIESGFAEYLREQMVARAA